MMEKKVSKLEETSSGYSSRESIPDSPIIITNTETSNSTCSCGKSNSDRSYLTPKFERVTKRTKSSSKYSGSNTMANQNESLGVINEKLILQNHQLQEQNQNLFEELQISRRFYQASLAELTSQLAIAESRIKYLQEVVNTHKDHFESTKKKENDIFSLPAIQGSSNKIPSESNRRTKSQNDISIKNPEKERSRSSNITSTGSDSGSTRTKLTLRQKVNMTKIKEELLQKNQQMKTDIANLKVKNDLPRSSSVPLLTSPGRLSIP